MAQNFSSQPLHPSDRLSTRRCTEPSRFWISIEEFNGRVQVISCNLERIKSFTVFAKNNYDRIMQRRLLFGDIKIFTEMLSFFLEKEFIDQKKKNV